MSENQSLTEVLGTEISEEITTGDEGVIVAALAGDDTINAGKSSDVIYGDYASENLLTGVEGATSFAQFGETGAWTVQNEASGHTSMSQTVNTLAGETYTLSFDLAANYGSGTVSGAVEVLWNGVVIDSFDTNSASFSAHDVSFTGVSGPGELTLRSIESTAEDEGPTINTDGPVFYYEVEKTIGGQSVTVKAFAEAQANIYQVINGTLQVFDPVEASYEKAGSDATVTINGIGFNVEDDLIYGIAVSDGVDSLGNAVSKSDLMMIDAVGDSYRVGSSPYRSWTADFDESGNLWAFHSSMDRITMIDVSNVSAEGVVASTTFKFPKSMITDQLWDVAYNAETQIFSGVTRPPSEGANGLLYTIDISEVASGGQPIFSTTAVTSTVIDGVTQQGMPLMTFGAAIYDADGNLYVAGNSGDHDMNDSTAAAGGIYRVITDPATGEAQLQLASGGPKSNSNDGTADPRAMDPFTEVDQAATVLIRQPNLIVQPEGSTSYDDVIESSQGADAAHGGLGDDQVAGQSGNDTITGGVGSDVLFGGNSDRVLDPQVDQYDEGGLRFDADGNLLPEDADSLLGGEGADTMYGNAGNDTLDGGVGDDYLDGGSGLDVMSGGIGDDVLAGGLQNDQLDGGEGNDTLIGSYGEDTLSGDDGDDDLQGGSESDTISGGDGQDTLLGGNGDDQLDGGAGDDTLNGGSDDDRLTDLEGDNTFIGGSGDDALFGGTGIDSMDGGSGDDELYGGGDNDILKGGSGEDVIHGEAGSDKLYGGSGGDELLGGEGNDYFNASSGDDTIDGGDGKDKILMGAGSDSISGGASDDRFVFRNGDQDNSVDIITDYARTGGEADKIDFRLLNLDADGSSKAEWIDDHVTQIGNGDVVIAFDGLEVRLLDHNDLGAAFLAQVEDGIFI
ncbi:MAG: type I secretion protein [Pseudomonadota bacterium]